MLTWIEALALGRKIGVYSSDVSGAVKAEGLVAKLRTAKVRPEIVAVIESWLRSRPTHVVVGGAQSVELSLFNMVFQGTVLGPSLWNTFWGDARLAIQECLYTEIVYADDLNASHVFPSVTSDDTILASLMMCQDELHNWGEANQVMFDPAKESTHIISAGSADGSNFKQLGVLFACNYDRGHQ